MSLRHRSTAIAVLLTCLAVAMPAHAELNAFMAVKASKQGEIRGGATGKGRDGLIQVNAVDHLIQAPVDASTGLPTGKRQHKPMVITKVLDRSSVPLRNAFTTNEVLSDVTLQFFVPTATGVEAMYLRIALKNARITSIRHVMPNNKDPELLRFAAYEEIAFVYESITWTWVDGGLEANDSVATQR